MIFDRRVLCAWHEAGHAIARLATGRPVSRVMIAEDGTGRTRYLTRRTSPPTPLTDAICCVAGPLVEAAVADIPLAEVLAGRDGAADNRMAEAALAQDASGANLRTAVRLAADLVARHGAAVEAVALALFDRGTLDGAALDEIFRK